MVWGKHKYGTEIGNAVVAWNMPEDPRGNDESIQAKDSSFDWSKGKKKHSRKVIKYEQFLGVKESIWTLLLQAIKKPYLEALKEDYIGYGGRMSN